MARLPRLTVPGYPHHVIQRGNNRQMIFRDAADHEFMLGLLTEQARKLQVEIHAYVLMGNHFHLLATPQTQDGLPLMMQSVGRSYVRYFNRRHQRSGTLWEGRYRSTIVQSERYLLACMVYIDLNPVRAGMLASAADYPWSSHAHLAGLRHDPLLTPHPLYWQLGNTPFAREQAYVNLVRAGLAPEQHAALGQAAHSGWALGGDDFIADLEKRTARRASRAARGRPVKAEETASN